MFSELGSYILAKFDVSKLSDIASKNIVLRVPYKFFSQRMIDYDFPFHLFLETTSACNLKCNICPRNHGETLVGHMEFDLFKKIIDEANQHGRRTFCLHLFGEPMLAPNFAKMIKYIKQVNKSNSIILTSNGTLLSQEIAEAIVDAPVDKLAISFVSADKANYTNIAGVDLLETVEKNVLNLLAVKARQRATRPRIYVRMIVNKNNAGEVEMFKNKWEDKGVKVEARPAHNYGGNVMNASYRENKVLRKKRHPCYHFWLSPAIHWNGDVSVCCNDWGRKALLGNVKTQTMNEIWNSEMLKKYRQEQMSGNYDIPSICKDCDVWTMYEDLFFWWQKK